MEVNTFSEDQKVNTVVQDYVHARFLVVVRTFIRSTLRLPATHSVLFDCSTGSDLFRICIRVGSV
jgi:hypothetical protein